MKIELQVMTFLDKRKNTKKSFEILPFDLWRTHFCDLQNIPYELYILHNVHKNVFPLI